MVVDNGNGLTLWMDRAKDIVKQVWEVANMCPGAEWVPLPPGFRCAFSVLVTLDGEAES